MFYADEHCTQLRQIRHLKFKLKTIKSICFMGLSNAIGESM